MLTVEPLQYLERIDAVRRENASCFTNIFLNTHELLETLKKKKTKLLQLENHALFIFIRYHDTYYDMYYVCSKETYQKLPLMDSFRNFIKELDLPVRIGISGTYDRINEDSKIFEQCGFVRNKTVGKVTSNATVNEYAKHFWNTSNPFISDNDNAKTFSDDLVVTFADISDVQEIFDMLCEEFDLIEDSIPEPDQILEDIKKKFVAIIKKDNSIIAIHYYRIKNRIRSNIYDYVKKNYRANGTIFILNNFVNKYVAEHENVVRSYGWRDITKKRLINAYKALGETFCNVYTTYLLSAKE